MADKATEISMNPASNDAIVPQMAKVEGDSQQKQLPPKLGKGQWTQMGRCKLTVLTTGERKAPKHCPQ